MSKKDGGTPDENGFSEPPKKKHNIIPPLEIKDIIENKLREDRWERKQRKAQERFNKRFGIDPNGPEAKAAGYGPKEENPIDKKYKKRYGQDYFDKHLGNVDSRDIPKDWKRWPSTYRALRNQGRFAGANEQEMDLILQMVKAGWLDGPQEDRHKYRAGSTAAMQKAIGYSQWRFPWAAFREDYNRTKGVA